ncbi:hypothetical protein DQX05_27840 [Paenibacillus thiaminolyticus]|uniref:Uncharacterized protein n=1 Tax=Paenibacillus thiaminolyticus TaxID=49283 RepID=A0A3A3G967_PANTH|nr:hypothetical protein DQX05_27840 [Paenibacillus thiaminolyticus]
MGMPSLDRGDCLVPLVRRLADSTGKSRVDGTVLLTHDTDCRGHCGAGDADIISLNWYSSLFPSMPLTYAPAFAGWLMWAYGLILLSGWAGIRRRQRSQ